MIFGYLILLIAVAISAIAAWYSIAGLIAIFAAAAIPVMIMGGALEAGKIVATVWLHNNWERAGWKFKVYLIPAVVALMVLTSMGIFGFLSKAHLDQNIISGDSQSRLALYDEKIANERDTINNARTLLTQLDRAVTDISAAPDREVNGRVISSAERALQVRKQQARERTALTQTIEQSQARIVKLQEERAPLAAEFRKIEAEVGPIKYIAALIYGDNPDQNLLEQAVRWVIILIVIVFDPLALTLILAANKQLEWARKGRGGWVHDEEIENEPEPEPSHVPPENRQGFSFFEFEKTKKEQASPKDDPVIETVLDTPPPPEDLGTCPKCETPIANAPGIGPFCPNKECDVVDGLLQARQEIEDKELQEFFWRGRMIARAIDADESDRLVQTANDQLAEIPPGEPDVDQVIADAEQIAALDLQRAELQAALDTLIEKYDELAADRDNLLSETQQINQQSEQQIEKLQQTLDQAQLRLLQAQTENATLSDAVVEIAREQSERVIDLQDQLQAREQELAALKLRIDELEQQSLEMASDLTELQSASPEPLPAIDQPESLLPEPEPEPMIAQPTSDERPGDYLGAPATIPKPVTPVVPGKGLRRGIQNNFQIMKAVRHAPSASILEDDTPESGTAGFGTRFPESAAKGDMFLRVDMMPNRAYKYNGMKWIEIDKNKTDRFAYDEAYVQHLSEGLTSGEYDLDDLNDTERNQVDQYRNKGTIL